MGRVAACLALLAALGVCVSGCREQTSQAAERGPDPTLASLPVGGSEISGSRIDPLFGDAADAITKGWFSFEIRCWDEQDWAEVVTYWDAGTGGLSNASGFILGLSEIQLSPDVCRGLTLFAYGPKKVRTAPPSDDAAQAIVVFAHEIGHSIVGADEAATRCWAMQKTDVVARVLEASRRTAAAVGPIVYEKLYPRMPAEYRSEECRDGGALDETPGDGSWP